MSWNDRFRQVFQSLLPALVLLCVVAADASAEERILFLQEKAAVPDQGSMHKAVDVQSAPTVTMLTIDQCIDITLRTNPSIIAALYSVDVSKEQVGQALSNYYPQVSALAAYNRVKPPLGTVVNNQLISTSYNEYTGTISLNQTIFDFGKTSSTVGISKYNLESSRMNLDTTENTTILSVKQAYYAVLQAKRNLGVAADVIKQYQLHLDQAEGFYKVGTNAKIDVITAKVNLSNAQLSLINADNTLKIAWVTLRNVMGVSNAPEFTIEDNLSFQKYNITLEDASVRAFENRPDLKSIISQVHAAEENISLQRTGYYPVLSGNASYTKDEIYLQPYTTSSSWDVEVALTIPLFNGFLTEHQVAGAKANLYLLKENEETVRQQIILDVRQSYLNLQAAEASISTAKLSADEATENLALANGRYVAGVGSTIEVSDAFATYVSAQAAYNAALYNYKIAEASIENAMGTR